MLGIVSEDENHNKIFKPMAGATLGQGVPLGAWCSFEKDVAPSSNWLMAGTTFDATKYPALNLYLGTNVVPSRYDHNRPSDYESITLSTDSNNPTVMDYDGFLVFTKQQSNNACYVYVNDNIVVKLNNAYEESATIPFSKGDKIYASYSPQYAKVCYYTHPLFIKATSIASDTDQQAILAQIQAYNTYSTEETLTGKTWIDGKPIYRCVIPFLNKQTVNSNGSIFTVGTALPSNLPFGNFSNISNFINGFIYRNNVNTITPLAVRYNSQTQITVFSIDGWGDTDGIILEYTKTND